MKRAYKNIQNLAKKVNQLTAYTLISQSAYINEIGWTSINNLMTEDVARDIVNVLGGHTATKEKIVQVLTTQKFSAWYLERIIYESKRKCWTYCAGQNYPAELQQIRNELKKR